MYCTNRKFYHKNGNPLRMNFTVQIMNDGGEYEDFTPDDFDAAVELRLQIRNGGSLTIEKLKADMSIDTAGVISVDFSSDELSLVDNDFYSTGFEIEGTDGNTTEPEPNIIYEDDEGNQIEFTGFYIIAGSVEAGT
jgi:hypothetical protein